MTGEPMTALDRIAEAFAAIDAARAYAFSTPAAMSAAAEALAGLDRDDLILVASALAALIATDMRPTGFVDLGYWREVYGFLLACREREA